METNIARENAGIIFQNLKPGAGAPLTSSIFKEDKLKTMSYLGRVWEKIVDYLTGGSASEKRIAKVKDLIRETLRTLEASPTGQFDVSTGFMRSEKHTLVELADRIQQNPEFVNPLIRIVTNRILRENPPAV